MKLFSVDKTGASLILFFMGVGLGLMIGVRIWP